MHTTVFNFGRETFQISLLVRRDEEKTPNSKDLGGEEYPIGHVYGMKLFYQEVHQFSETIYYFHPSEAEAFFREKKQELYSIYDPEKVSFRLVQIKDHPHSQTPLCIRMLESQKKNEKNLSNMFDLKGIPKKIEVTDPCYYMITFEDRKNPSYEKIEDWWELQIYQHTN